MLKSTHAEWLLRMAAVLGLGATLVLIAEYSAQEALVGSISARAYEPVVLLGILGAHVALALIIGLSLLAVREASRLPGPGAALHKRLVAGALLALPAGAWLGARLAAGDWVAAQSFAWVLPPLVALLVLGAAALWIGLANRYFGRPWLHVAAAVASVLLAVANVAVLPGLYVEAHLSLYVTCLGLSLLAGSGWPRTLGDGRFARWTILGPAAMAVLGLAALPSGLGEARAEIVRSSPGVGAVFALIAPPPQTSFLGRELLRASSELPSRLDPPAKAPPLAAPARSVLWVMVDTLRADALPPVRNGDEPFVKEADTPQLNRWLSGAYRFENAYSQASQTRNSIPPTFRSLQPFEDPSTHGTALGHYARSLGLEPVALVPHYFLMPAQPVSQALLDGFEAVEVFETSQQETMLLQAERLLTPLKGTPFLAWVHFYNMHQPYFAGPPGGPKPTSRAAHYGQALRWLDGRFGELMELLSKLDLAKDTIVVLAADHGEQLGEDTRLGHGFAIGEPEIRVPLAIHVPGTQGGLVKALVSNVDILPTLLELLGRPADPAHRGESMVDLMGKRAARSERVRYVRSGSDKFHGLLTQEEKLVYVRDVGSFSLFSRNNDPRDERDLLGVDPARDARLISFMVQSNPGLFGAELQNLEVQELLRRALSTVSVQAPSPRLELLLATASVSDSKNIREDALAIFERSENLEVKLMVFRHLAEVDASGWSTRWEKVLIQHAGKSSELALVRALAAQKLAASNSPMFPERLKALSESNGADAELLDAWLALIEPWQGKSSLYAAAFLKLAQAAASDPMHAERLTTVLSNVGTLQRAEPEVSRPLEAVALTALAGAELEQRVAACKALGVVAGDEGYRALQSALHEPGDARVRQAAMHALAQRGKQHALADLVRAGEDPLLTADAIVVLRDLGDPAALPFLSKVANNSYSIWTRRLAVRALSTIEQRRKHPSP